MTTTGAAAKDVFDRWTPVWHGFFFAMIALATTLSLGQADGTTGASRVGVVTLVAALSVSHGLLIVRPGRGHRERPRQVALYLAVAILVSTLLVAIDRTFLMVAMTLYNQIFAFMVMRWALPFAIALTAGVGLVATRNAGMPATILVVLCASSATLIAVYLTASADESRKRRELIEELERTRERLALAERLAGAIEERHRIGRELHDTVTQQLIGIVMHLEAASEVVAEDHERARAALGRSLGLAREGLAEARRLVWAERPAPLEHGSLTQALREVGGRVATDAGLEVEQLLDEGIDALPAAVQTLVLRAVQEALANVRKHAHARRVTVTVSADDELLTLDVQDDGVGFAGPPGAASKDPGAGFGLRGLRERVEAVGGQLSIESEAGAGTTIALHVPLRVPADGARPRVPEAG